MFIAGLLTGETVTPGRTFQQDPSYAAIMQNLSQIVRGKLPWNSWIQNSTGGYGGERLRTEIDKETSLEFGFL